MNEYYTDVSGGSSGIIKSNVKIPRNTFAMRLKALVQADEHTGYYAEVIRELDKEKRFVA